MEGCRVKSPSTLLARNKKKSSKFSSSEDARTSRAVQRKLEQKKQRNLSLAQHRSISTPHQKTAINSSLTPLARTNCKLYSKSITSTTKKYSQNELEKLGRVRYQDMLQWKKEKNKLIAIERKKRKPTFVSGVYKPDAPKFLISSDQPSVRGTTPSLMSSSKQKIKYGSISKSMRAFESKMSAGNSKACKPLEFGTGQTPLGTKELKRGRKLRSSKPVLSHLNSFGITPLPITPTVISDQQASSEELSKPAVGSFAPNLFHFEVPAGLKSYDFSSNKKAVRLVCSSISEDVEEKPETLCTDFDISTDETSANEAEQTEEVPVKAEQTEEVPVKAQQTEEVPVKAQQTEEFPVKAQQTEEVTLDTQLALEVPVNTQPFCEPVIKVCFDLKTLGSDEENSGYIHEEMSLKLSDSSDTDADDLYLPLFEANKLVENAGQTPAPTTGRRTRLSIAVIKEKDSNNDLSLTSRLRPRTPCSRSTRRSHSAHCDHFSLESLVTPNRRSTKKEKQFSLRKSINNITNNKVSKLNMATPIMTTTPDLIKTNDILFPSLKGNASSDKANNYTPFKTPLSHIVKKTPGSRIRISSLIDTSPWINKSRGSSSSNGKQRRSVFSNDLERMFNELPLDGSLPTSLLNEIGISASPVFNQSANTTNSSQIVAPDDPNCSFKENMTPELKKFLQPSTISLFQEKYKPDVLVWTPDSAESSPVFPSTTHYSPIEKKEDDSKLLPVSTSFIADDNNQREPLSEISVPGNVSKRRRRTRHTSVTFADNISSSEKTGYKFPTTPVARSSRVSLGLFSDVRVDEELPQPVKPGEKLILLDSPIVLAGSQRKSQLRGAHRISLLPGLEACSEKEEIENKVPIIGDLISFDTPTKTPLTKKNKRLSKQAADTPLRRSRRISHVIPP